MEAVAQWLLYGGLSLNLFLAGALWRALSARIDKGEETAQLLGKRLVEFQLEVAKTYPSRESLKEALQPILSALTKIEETQERLFERLDRKVDK